MMMPPPKFATLRDPDAPTRGTKQALFADRMLGCPFMPVQSYIADVSGELLPDGRPRYPLVVVTMQRRGGKSHLSMSQIGERAFSVSGFRAWYTAQSGGDARDAFLKFHEETVAGSAMELFTRTLVGNGREVMKFANGSTFRPFPPTEAALHGKETDRVDADEAWAFTEEEGRALLQAIGPTQLTRPGGQIFIWSAGGTAASTWLADLVARGRGGDPTLAYFEWGIPDDADAEDLDVIAANHPAYGHTIDMASLRALRQTFGDDAAGWARAAGNRWTEVIGGAIPADVYEGAQWADPVPEGTPVGYGAATSLDRTETAIVAAVELDDGRVVVEVIDVVPHGHGVHDKVASWCHDGPAAVDPVGPSATLWDNLRTRTRTNVMPLTTGDVTAACAGFGDGLADGSIKVRRHPALDAAVAVAVKRNVRDGAFVWARRAAGASVAALEAATLAVWAVRHRPPATGEPFIYFPEAS